MKKYKWLAILAVFLKFAATIFELILPYILEHLLDNIVPLKEIRLVIIWGLIMILTAVVCGAINAGANITAVKVSSRCAYQIRNDLFKSSIYLTGKQVDEFGLPSLTSRMTSDSYNLQDATRGIISIGIRAPFMLIGGIAITFTMDPGLALILCVMVPIVIVIVVTISFKGIPLYTEVQKRLDNIVRIMRENITGIRVVKALSKEEYEKNRFEVGNGSMNKQERKAGVIMSLPGPVMTLFLNIGLALVVFVGARRVNSGQIKPAVILSFLTYFNLILQSVMGLSRVFLMLSKANASAQRISVVTNLKPDLEQMPEETASVPEKGDYIVFDDVTFNYGIRANESDTAAFSGEKSRKALENVSFTIAKGGSLGIIGPTGCGKTSIINLLMRFYDPEDGHVFVGGKDVRTMNIQELRRKFGVVFQNDVIFADSLMENIEFGRNLGEEKVKAAVEDARAEEFVFDFEDGLEHQLAIKGSDLSGGQRQRVLVARALASDPDILVLDDSSSALDYKTDAALRKAINEHHADATTIVIAQRISSIMNLDKIIVMDEGRVIGYGTHEELLASCQDYVDIYNTQMGEGGIRYAAD